MKTPLSQPFLHSEDKPYQAQGTWPARWIALPGSDTAPMTIAAYRCRFSVETAVSIRVFVGADERYDLFLDGKFVGRGNERGDSFNWYFEAYDLELAAGHHILVARVWSLGPAGPTAQIRNQHGLILASDQEDTSLLNTGSAFWECKAIAGIACTSSSRGLVGQRFVIDGRIYPWDVTRGGGEGWMAPVVNKEGLSKSHGYNISFGQCLLTPGTLPAMLNQRIRVGRIRHASRVELHEDKQAPVEPTRHDPNLAAQFQALIREKSPVTLGETQATRVIIDLGNYYCAYPSLTLSGKGSALVRWCEAFHASPTEQGKEKGNRNAIDHKRCFDEGDAFIANGEAQRFVPLWWRAGRYMDVWLFPAPGETFTIDTIALLETRYPLEAESSFSSSDPRLESLQPIMLRTLQMCAHETYMDCPYYEQLQYIGDTRLQALITYTLTRDGRLPRKALELMHSGRSSGGLTKSNHPTRGQQTIPPFSLFWICMLHDYVLWRGDIEWIRTQMPRAREVMDHTLLHLNKDGFLQGVVGWNFMDWVGEWDHGVPPDGKDGVSSLLNLQLVYTLQRLAELEEWMGEDEYAHRADRIARELYKKVDLAFWNSRRGLYADDLAHRHYSEHTQCLAILSGLADTTARTRIGETLAQSPSGLSETTIYFSHYLFETYRELGLISPLFDRMQLWFELEQQGFKTTFENPQPTRSDCHAWGAHPLYHYFATLAGIRPTTPGFETLEIRPAFGPLDQIRTSMVHPKGTIIVDLTRDRNRIEGTITLPPSTSGNLYAGNSTTPLRPGSQNIRLSY